MSRGSVPAYGTGADSRYQPRSITVPRARSAGGLTSATFAGGANAAVFTWQSFSATSSVTIPSDPSVSLMDDLILTVYVNQSVLSNARGMVISVFPNAARALGTRVGTAGG